MDNTSPKIKNKFRAPKEVKAPDPSKFPIPKQFNKPEFSDMSEQQKDFINKLNTWFKK